MLIYIKSKVRNYIAKIAKVEAEKALHESLNILPQLLEFYSSSEKERQSYYDSSNNPLRHQDICSNIKNRLITLGIPVIELDIDVNDFKMWLQDYREIQEQYKKMGKRFIEKCLEHYLAFRVLRVSKNDVYIDIASGGSRWASILNTRGIKSYALDISYPQGIHGRKIGADAGKTQLPNSFASVMSAHCAFECFIGDSDVKFIIEASRILTQQGRYGIIPLYLDDTYFIVTSPYCNQQDIVIDEDAKRVWRDDEFKAPFSRHYSPEAFKKRIFSNIPEDMEGKVVYFRNLLDIMKHYPDQTLYCFFMFVCAKQNTLG